jgi:YbgC/YbaW family acyl-CoA thioester hydrolase
VGTFTHEITVRFHEVDRAGIVFFGRIFEYCHVAFEEILRAMELTSVFERENWGMPLVHAEADFKRPMRMGDRIAIVTTIERRTGGSLTFAFEVLGAEDRQLRASVRHVHAFVALDTMEPTAFPPSLDEGLTRLGL